MLRHITLWASALILFALASAPVTSAQVQVPKSGKFSAHYGWKGVQETRDVGEGILFLVGEDHGSIFNDAGSGIFHNTGSTCLRTIFVDTKAGNFTANGHCYVADADGDQIFLLWDCEGPAKGPGAETGRCKGKIKSLGGTKKYAGITGTMEFHGGGIGASPYGYSIWKGEYRIP